MERAFAHTANIPALRNAIAPEVERAQQVQNNPQSHPELRAEYEEAFGDDAEYELRAWAKHTARTGGAALKALNFLETLGRHEAK